MAAAPATANGDVARDQLQEGGGTAESTVKPAPTTQEEQEQVDAMNGAERPSKQQKLIGIDDDAA